MFTPSTMQECFKSLLGWRNASDLTLPQITDPELLASESGLYYNDFNPFITTEMMTNAIPLTDDFEDYLKIKVSSATTKLMTKFVNLKKELNSTKTLLNSSRMFDGPGRFDNVILNQGRFVGFEIELKSSYGLKAIIDNIGFQFSAAQTNLDIYLFHTSQEDPIQTFQITTTNSRSFQWVTPGAPIDFSYYNSIVNSGGLFYLGYFQDDIAGQAIQTDFNFAKGPCNTCSGSGNLMKIWSERMNWIRVTPIFVAGGNLNGTQMFNYKDAVQDQSNNYGMNFATTIQCDLSQYFCENKNIFAEALGKQVAIDVLFDIKNSTRNNQVVNVAKNMIIRDLEGDRETFELGLLKRFEQSLESLNFDFSKVDSPCLPDVKKYGVKRFAV